MAWIVRLIIVTFIMVMVQSFIFYKMGLRGVIIRRSFSSRHAFQEDEIYLYEEIINRRPVPVPLLVIESRIHKSLGLSTAVELEANASNYHRSVFSMLPFCKIVRKHKVRLLKRGYYPLKSIAVSTYDLLGFIKVAKDELPLEGAITVYPKFLDEEALNIPSHSFLGDWVVRRWIIDDPFVNAGVRSYLPTDPMKKINWKATARTGDLMVNNHDYTADTRLLILFNSDLTEIQWSGVTNTELLEQGLSMCATYAKQAVERGLEVSFASNGQNLFKKEEYAMVPMGSGEQHLYIILEELALLSFDHVTSFHYFLGELLRTSMQKSDILIVTAYMDHEIENQIELIRRADHSVECIHLKEAFPHGD